MIQTWRRKPPLRESRAVDRSQVDQSGTTTAEGHRRSRCAGRNVEAAGTDARVRQEGGVAAMRPRPRDAAPRRHAGRHRCDGHVLARRRLRLLRSPYRRSCRPALIASSATTIDTSLERRPRKRATPLAQCVPPCGLTARPATIEIGGKAARDSRESKCQTAIQNVVARSRMGGKR
jgi:hypothetical protein